jgi:type IV pilus assembly protein PilX
LKTPALSAHSAHAPRKQRGVALVVSLLFLLVVTLVSLAAARNSALNLRMAGNMQDMVISFQSAEAGAMALMGMSRADPANDPFNVSLPDFRDNDTAMPTGLRAAYVGNLRNGLGSVGVSVRAVSRDRPCPRATRQMSGSSYAQQVCTYYRVRSEHTDDGRSRSRVQMGVVKTTIN